jgi:hypothetical protein
MDSRSSCGIIGTHDPFTFGGSSYMKIYAAIKTPVKNIRSVVGGLAGLARQSSKGEG